MISIELKYELKSTILLIFNNNNNNQEYIESIFKCLVDRWLSTSDKEFLNESFIKIINSINQHLSSYSLSGNKSAIVSVITSLLLDFEIESYSDQFDFKNNQNQLIKSKELRSLQIKDIKNYIQLMINSITSGSSSSSSSSTSINSKLSPPTVITTPSTNSNTTTTTTTTATTTLKSDQSNSSTDHLEIIFEDNNIDNTIQRIKKLYSIEQNKDIKLELDTLSNLIIKDKDSIQLKLNLFVSEVQQNENIKSDQIRNQIIKFKYIEEIGRLIQRDKLSQLFKYNLIPSVNKGDISGVLNKLHKKNEIYIRSILKQRSKFTPPVPEFKINNHNQVIPEPTICNSNINIYLKKLYNIINAKSNEPVQHQQQQQQQAVVPASSHSIVPVVATPQQSLSSPSNLSNLLNSTSISLGSITSIEKTKERDQLQGGLNRVLDSIIKTVILKNRVILEGGKNDKELNIIKEVVFKNDFTQRVKALITSSNQWVELNYGSSVDDSIKENLKNLLCKLKLSIILNNCIQIRELLVYMKPLKLNMDEKEDMYSGLVEIHGDRERIEDFRTYNDSNDILFNGFLLKGDDYEIDIPELQLYSDTIINQFTILLKEFKFITSSLPSSSPVPVQSITPTTPTTLTIESRSIKLNKSPPPQQQQYDQKLTYEEKKKIKKEKFKLRKEKKREQQQQQQKESDSPLSASSPVQQQKVNDSPLSASSPIQKEKENTSPSSISSPVHKNKSNNSPSSPSSPLLLSQQTTNKSMGIWLNNPETEFGKILKSIVDSVIKTNKIKCPMLDNPKDNESNIVKDITLIPEFTSSIVNLLSNSRLWVHNNSTKISTSKHEKNLLSNLITRLNVSILLNNQYQKSVLCKSIEGSQLLSLDEKSKAIQDFTTLQAERLKSILKGITDFGEFRGSINSLFSGYTVSINKSIEINIPELSISQVNVSNEFSTILNEFKQFIQYLPKDNNNKNQITVTQSLLDQLNNLNHKDQYDINVSELTDDFIKITIKSP